MNDRSLILKIIQHPLIREAMENELATSSIITRLIAEELQKEVRSSAEGEDVINTLSDYLKRKKGLYDKVKEFLNAIESKKAKPEDLQAQAYNLQPKEFLAETVQEWETQFDQIKRFIKEKNYNEASRLIYMELEKRIKLINKVYQVSNQNDHKDVSGMYPDYLVWSKAFEVGVAVVKLYNQKPKGHPCIELLMDIILELENDSKKSTEQTAETFDAFVKVAESDIKLLGNQKNKFAVAYKVYADSLKKNKEAIDKFVEMVATDGECKTQFKALEKTNPQEFIIGKFLILRDQFLEKIGRPEDEKPDKMLDAMKRTNKLATEQKDIYWSLDGGFTQVFEVAYLPAGSETANNGTEEKPLTDYNISQENLKTGKKGSILIVRSEQLYKVEKIVQEQEEGKRVTVSIPIDNVKQYNALFSGTEDEKGMPTGPGAFFVHSDQEKMVPLKKPEPEEEEEETATEPEKIDLEEGAIKNYLDAFELFKTKFLNVKKLHTQSEIFRQFYMTIFPIAGINPDTIVGQQLDAYTQTAAGAGMKITKDETNIDDEEDKNLNEEEKEGKNNLTKNISQNAKVIERHANAILEILEGYEKYLNIGGTGKGVEQGSRILFNKFGESDPKKLITKFVKLIIKDINAAIKSSNEMIELADKKLKSQDDKKEKEQEEPQELNEAAVDNSVRELPTRDKIILVIKTGKKVILIGEKLKEMIARTYKPGEEQAEKEAAEKAAAEKAAAEKAKAGKEGEQTQPDTDKPAGKRDDLLEAETKASDARINADPTGTDSGARELRKLKARGSDEISLGYKEEAKKIYELLTKIRPLFPTSQPFDTNYSFSVAMESFKSALTGLSTNVAQVSGYEYDQLTDTPVLRSFVKKLESFKNTIKDIFGYTQEAQDAENQASFNEEGEDSGLPHPEPAKPTAKDDKDPEEIPEEDKELLTKAYRDDAEYYEKIVKRQKELSAGESALDTGFVPEEPETLNEVLENTEKLIRELESMKTRIRLMEKNYDKKQRKNNIPEIAKAKELLLKALNRYISLYKKIGKAIQYRDFSSVLDDPGTRVKRINLLMKETEKFLEEHKTTKEFFLGLTTTDPKSAKDPAYLEGVFKRMKRLDGQMPAIVDADMRYKIKRAKINIGKIFQNKFPKSNYNFSSFKTFVGKVADQISAVAIRIDNALKEEEDPSSPEVKQKEFEMYNKQVIEVIDLMKKFLTLYTALELAMDHLQNKDVGRTRFLEAFDKEFSTISNFIKNSRMYIKKISTKFRNGEPNIAVAKIYGFPPTKTTSEPEKVEVEGDPDVISDITDFKEELSRNLKEEIDVIEKEIKEEGIGILYKFYKFLISLNENKASQEYANNLHKQIKDKDGLNLNKKGIRPFVFALKQNEREQLSDAIKFLSTKREYIEGFKKMLGQMGSAEPEGDNETDSAEPEDNKKQSKKPTFTDEQKDQEELFDYIVKGVEQVDLFQDKIQEISTNWDAGYEDDAGQKMDTSSFTKSDINRIRKPETPEEFVRKKLTRFTYGNKVIGRRFIKQVMNLIDAYRVKKKDEMPKKEVYRVAENLFERDDVLDYFKSIIRKGPNKEKPIGTFDPENRKKSPTDDEDVEFVPGYTEDEVSDDFLDKPAGSRKPIEEQIANKLKPLIREMLNKGK